MGRRYSLGWWPALLFVLMMQAVTPLLALAALAAPMTPDDVPICAAHGSPSAPASHQDGVCPVCAFCAAVQPALTPAPVAAPLPLIRPGLALTRGVGMAWHEPAVIAANARSPPGPSLSD